MYAILLRKVHCSYVCCCAYVCWMTKFMKKIHIKFKDYMIECTIISSYSEIIVGTDWERKSILTEYGGRCDLTGEKAKPPENTCKEKAAWYKTIQARKVAANINPILWILCNMCFISVRCNCSFDWLPLISSLETIFWSAAISLATCVKSMTEFCISCVYIQVATYKCIDAYMYVYVF